MLHLGLRTWCRSTGTRSRLCLDIQSHCLSPVIDTVFALKVFHRRIEGSTTADVDKSGISEQARHRFEIIGKIMPIAMRDLVEHRHRGFVIALLLKDLVMRSGPIGHI